MAGKFKDERRLLREAREGGYVVSQDALNALAQNLRTTQAGVGETYTDSAAKVLDRMRALQGRIGRRADQVVDRASTSIANQYGSAIAGGAAEALRPSSVAAKGTGKLTVASTRAAAGLAKAGEYALAIQQAAASEATESAAYMLASALAYRARDDASLLLEKKLALQQTRLQYKLQLENEKAMYDYTQEQESKALGGRQGATDTVRELAALMPQIRLYMDDNPEATWADVSAKFADLIGANPNFAVYLQEVFATYKRRNLFGQDLGYAASVDAIVDSLLTLNPEWRKFRPALEKMALSSLDTAWEGVVAGRLDTDDDDGGKGPPPGAVTSSNSYMPGVTSSNEYNPLGT